MAISGTATGGTLPARGTVCLRLHHQQLLTRELPDAGKAVEVLLNRHRISLDNTDTSGLTPLHWAAAKGKLACLANVSLHNCSLSCEATGLIQAQLQHEVQLRATSCCASLVEPYLLLESPGRVHMTHPPRPSSVLAAAGYTVMVELLLSHGADVSALDAWGFHPQHWAAHQGHANCLISLLNYGAALNERDRAGKASHAFECPADVMNWTGTPIITCSGADVYSYAKP